MALSRVTLLITRIKMKEYIKPEILIVKIGVAHVLLAGSGGDSGGGDGGDSDYDYVIPITPGGEGDASEEGC